MFKNTIRNFAIIAHVDHGKSTLADRLLELTGTVDPNKHDEQLLDRNPISRARGITIKLAPVRMLYSKIQETSNKIQKISNVNSQLSTHQIVFNLVDTPGHVDFSYEVERTLACVEAAILLVDATQGIQAQTIAHTYKALEQNLHIIPVVNKIDAPHAEVEKTVAGLSEFLGISENTIHKISAKTGQGIQELLESLAVTVPAPENNKVFDDLSSDDKTRALIFDSYYDSYRGVIAFVRVFTGSLKKGDSVYLHGSDSTFTIDEVGIFTPDLVPQDSLSEGEIGYVVTKSKDIHQVQVGDSMTGSVSIPALKGYKKVHPMVYTSFFPTEPEDFPALVDALEKLTLNDSALEYEQMYSFALGAGVRIGFLGLLHADVVRQRLENEYDLSIISTPPTVHYESHQQGAKLVYEEPMVNVTVVCLAQYLGDIMNLAAETRGVFKHMDNRAGLIQATYDMPLSELISGFFDRLKTVTSGYGSLDWEFIGYQPADVDKLVIMLNLTPVEELSQFVVHEKAYYIGRDLTNKLKEVIPRQQYEVKIQAYYKGKIIASTRVAPLRKDVTAKLYGGDRTRKDKLLKKQKEGKKKMKMIGKINLPKDVFLKLFTN